MARFNLHLALALITAIFVSYTCAANGRGGSSRSIDASSGSVNNYFQTPAFWTDAQYGKGWGGWSMAASNIEYQIKTATHQDVQLSGDFLHDSFQGALRRVVVNADDSKYEQLEAGTSGDQLAEFGKVRPKTNLIDQDAHVIKDLSDTLEEQTMKNIENGVAKETLSQISLPKELQQLLPSNQNDAGSLVAGFCKESDQPVVPIDAFLDPALQPACARNKYRSHSGFCNNICFPNRGRESSTFLRNLAPDYADKKSGLRVSSSKKPLPSARLVSSRVITQTIDDAPTWTAMFTQFGQFLAHDLTSTAQERPRCCGVAKGKQSPDCIPITIPRDDPFYSKFGEKCMECARSRIGVRIGCRLGHREQLNQNSAYIDGSAIYGVNDALIFQVRDTSAGSKGRLEVSAPFANNPAYHLLPGAEKSALTNDTVVCLDKTPGRPCFIAGDERCNTQAGLQTTHTLFVRHHNNIVNKLSGFPETSDWSDEKFYQEARAIIAAQLQHITYNEFLPVLLGPLVVNERGLAVLKTGRFRGYDVTVDAG
ncbi:putative Chorion peroxidase [Hypsibius exemplaris]|uniref:Chorion peroxidase n=1 Tax=Hypsibius exemplaris TaxID=2072580 RepID=A0A1W0X5L2_HYPEX|nr:putative Chorion peroxidase [Hypsibius exemplaris]